MKQQDIAILIIIVFIAGIASFVVANKFVAPSKEEKAEKVSAISKDFNTGNASNINESSINPAVRIEIAPNNNEQPFTNGQQ